MTYHYTHITKNNNNQHFIWRVVWKAFVKGRRCNPELNEPALSVVMLHNILCCFTSTDSSSDKLHRLLEKSLFELLLSSFFFSSQSEQSLLFIIICSSFIKHIQVQTQETCNLLSCQTSVQ